MICSNLKTHAQSLAKEYILTLDTSIIIPPLAPAERQFNVERLQPRSVTVVLDDVTGAPRMISVVFLGQTRSEA